MALALALSGCLGGGGDGEGDGDGGGGLSAAFSALHGEYRVKHDADCFIKILGSQVSAVDGSGSDGCLEDRGDGEGSEALEVDGTLTDTRISGTLTYVESFPEQQVPDLLGDSCLLGVTREVTIEATAVKTMGREATGRFAGLAGRWEGSLAIRDVTESTGDCSISADDDSNQFIDFEVEVAGTFAMITYVEDGRTRDFEITADDSGELFLDGEPIEMR